MTEDQAREFYLLEGKVTSLSNMSADHEVRLRFIERQIYKWLGATAVISAALALTVHFIFHL